MLKLKESENRKVTGQLVDVQVQADDLKRQLSYCCKQKLLEAQSASQEALSLNEQVVNLQSFLISSGEELSPDVLWTLNPTL